MNIQGLQQSPRLARKQSYLDLGILEWLQEPEGLIMNRFLSREAIQRSKSYLIGQLVIKTRALKCQCLSVPPPTTTTKRLGQALFGHLGSLLLTGEKPYQFASECL